MLRWEAYIKTNTFAVYSRTMTVSKKHAVQLSYKGNVYFTELHFYLQNRFIKTWLFDRYFYTDLQKKSLSIHLIDSVCFQY